MKTTQTKKFNGTSLIEQESVQQFRDALRGDLIYLGHEDYKQASTIYNGMIQKKPALIARCRNAGDVITAVNFARDEHMLLAVRSGGHNGPGLGTCDDGLVIDLSLMKGIYIDPKNKTARVEPGCTWGDVDHAAHAFGLATVSGIISTTGVGGLTLGGGHGYLSRKYGLTIDNLISADLVLADGRFVTASEDENADLYWAIRGGGGNFGVVTSFKFRLHPVDRVAAGPMFWTIDKIGTLLRWYRDFIKEVPEDVYAFFLTAEVPGDPFPPEIHGEKVCGVLWCYLGPEDRLDSILQQAREVEKPLFEHVGYMPYPALQSMFDALYPPGMQWYWKGDFFRDLTDEAIEKHEEFAAVPTTFSTMHLYPVNGAVHKKSSAETAWNHRDVTWSMVIAGVDPDPDKVEEMSKWARDYWQALHPYSAGAAYINFMMNEGRDRVAATYGDNFQRLQQIKTKYDPENLFRVNQNIPPEGWKDPRQD